MKMVMFKDFFKNLKNYLSYIMKVGFGELFIQFLTLVIILLISLFVYIPLGLIQDLVVTFFSTIGLTLGETGYLVLNLIFKSVELVVAICCFVYLFNKRYEDFKKAEEEKKNDIKDLDNKEDNEKQDTKKSEETDIEKA